MHHLEIIFCTETGWENYIFSCPPPPFFLLVLKNLLFQGAKLFYFSGLIHGQYPKAEVHNLARFISVMKFRPLDWRASHPYVLADRMEDLTDPELVRTDKNCDRSITLYGYVRGTNMKSDSTIHIPGTK